MVIRYAALCLAAVKVDGLAGLKEHDAAKNPSVKHLIEFIETTERGVTR